MWTAKLIAQFKRPDTYLVLLSTLLYGLAFYFPAFDTGFIEANSASPGIEIHQTYTSTAVLLIGWLGIIALMLGWYANPFAMLALLFYLFNVRVAAWFSGFAFLLALTSFLPTRFNADGPREQIVNFHLGFWLWLCALLLLAIACWLRFYSRLSFPATKTTK